jgi:hypothetical protein
MKLPLNRYFAPQYHDLLTRTLNTGPQRPEPEPDERFGSSQFRIYKDPLAPDASVLMKFKGDTFMDVGYFYCPYHLMSTKTEVA